MTSAYAEEGPYRKSLSMGFVGNGIATVNPVDHYIVLPEALLLLETEVSLSKRFGLLIGFGGGAVWPHTGESLFLGAHRGGARVQIQGHHFADFVYAIDSLYRPGGAVYEFAVGGEVKYVYLLPHHVLVTFGVSPAYGHVLYGEEHSGLRIGFIGGVGFDFAHWKL